jgi:hypothetical protein
MMPASQAAPDALASVMNRRGPERFKTATQIKNRPDPRTNVFI